jgi:hypothetical protein
MNGFLGIATLPCLALTLCSPPLKTLPPPEERNAEPSLLVSSSAIPPAASIMSGSMIAREGGVTQDGEGFGPKFRRAWIPITGGEVVLLGVTASLPKSWTGWSAHFVRDGVNHLGEAWSKPPMIDTDRWYHNYLGHPYGGSLYYNSVRCQGATVGESFAMSVILSTQWEYVFEAVAERPSIQDLIVTPVIGSLLGEVVHRTTQNMKRNGTTFPEKLFITLFNPMSEIMSGD